MTRGGRGGTRIPSHRTLERGVETEREGERERREREKKKVSENILPQQQQCGPSKAAHEPN